MLHGIGTRWRWNPEPMPSCLFTVRGFAFSRRAETPKGSILPTGRGSLTESNRSTSAIRIAAGCRRHLQLFTLPHRAHVLCYRPDGASSSNGFRVVFCLFAGFVARRSRQRIQANYLRTLPAKFPRPLILMMQVGVVSLWQYEKCTACRPYDLRPSDSLSIEKPLGLLDVLPPALSRL